MSTSWGRSVDSASLLRKLLVAEVYEHNDPSFGPLHAISQVDGCVRCLAAADALVLFREPPTAAVALIAACGLLDPRVAAVNSDDELIVGLCRDCLTEFYDLEVPPN